MSRASRWPAVQHRSPPGSRMSCSCYRPTAVFHASNVMRQTEGQTDTRGSNTEDEALLGCRFPLIHLIHQRIYKACYLNATPPKTTPPTPLINTAARRQHIHIPAVCRQAPRKSMERQYFIIVLFV